MRENRLTLTCGRELAYAEFGAPDGLAVMYCHGFPGSRLEAEVAHRVARTLGIRLIAADRPGFGCSDASPARTLLGWAEDLRELADRLELDEFSMLGVSGGAPYALACAFALPRRIRSAAIVSGLAPRGALAGASRTSTSGLGLRITTRLPRSAQVIARVLSILACRASPLLFTIMSATAPRADRRALNDGKFRSSLAASMREAFRNGASGAATDLRLLCASWGFDLRSVNVPIRIWHGARDRVVPISMGRFLEQRLPDCLATYFKEHGHYSLVHDCADQILYRLID